MKYTAKPPSKRTDDWPLWFVADESGLNVTADLAPELSGHLPFIPRVAAEELARRATEDGGKSRYLVSQGQEGDYFHPATEDDVKALYKGRMQ